MRSSDRYSAPETRTKDNKQLIVGVSVGGGALLLILVLALALGGGDKPGKGNDAVAAGDGGGTVNGAIDESDAERKSKMLTDDYEAAETLPAKMNVLGQWRATVANTPGLSPQWKKYVVSTLDARINEIKASTGSTTEKAGNLSRAAAWVSADNNTSCALPGLGRRVWEAVLEIDSQNERANKALGNVRYKPEDPLIIRADEDAEGARLLGDLGQYVGRYWSPAKMREIRAIEQRLLRVLRDHFDRVDTDPFFKMALQEKSRLERLTTFDGFEFDVVIIRPWVLLITTEGNTRQLFESRREAYEKLLAGTWSEWKKVITRLGLTSAVEGDSLENPRPFVAVGFATKETYLEFQAEQERYLSPSTRAFYDPNNRTVNFYESDEGGIGVVYDDDATLVHEASHQIMDRYSSGGCLDYRAHFFTEGYPEYNSYFSGNGLNLRFAGLSPKENDRSDNLCTLRTYFNGQRSPLPGQMTDDDWVFFDVPMLLSLRDSAWVTWIGGKYIYNSFYDSDYMNRRIVRQWLGEDPADFFHVMFYAFAWSFMYWLHDNYPDEIERYARVTMNRGTGKAEVFLQCFNIRTPRELPDLDYWCGENNSTLRANADEAYDCWLQRLEILRSTPKIVQMHEEWVAWMKTQFPVSEEVDTADLDREPGPMGGGPIDEESQAEALAEFEATKAELLEYAARAVAGDGEAMMIFQLVILTYLSRGVPIETINEMLAEGDLELDMSTLRPRRR